MDQSSHRLLPLLSRLHHACLPACTACMPSAFSYSDPQLLVLCVYSVVVDMNMVPINAAPCVLFLHKKTSQADTWIRFWEDCFGFGFAFSQLHGSSHPVPSLCLPPSPIIAFACAFFFSSSSFHPPSTHPPHSLCLD